VLTINGGSSSIRFAVYDWAAAPRCRLSGKIDRIGLSGSTLSVSDARGKPVARCGIPARDHRTAAHLLLDWLSAEPCFPSIRAVGHRVVHGMRHSKPERITPRLVAELRGIIPYDPDHLKREIGLIETFSKRHPGLPQFACFDTAFHSRMPRLAKLLPIPRRYGDRGVQRYGFHGLSYAFLMEELRRIDPGAAKGRVILAHLGNGASLAAVRNGRSLDTSMGFTPAAGLVMSTRSGDLDPGLLSYLARAERMTPARFERMVNHESGLLGVSGTSSDMRDLLARGDSDKAASEAVGLFCYQAMKWIGSYAAVLGGLETLVFAGGIGENAPVVRQRICAGLAFLGIGVDRRRNAANSAVISRRGGRVRVRVIHTNEEWMIARSVCREPGILR
jgi:acetate kinase